VTALELLRRCPPSLASVPASWGRERLRWFIQDLSQGWSPEAEDREPSASEWGVLKLNAVQRGKFNVAAVKTVPPELEVPASLEVRAGDVLVTRANTPGQVGDVCFVIKARPRVIISDLIYRLRLHEDRIDGRFLTYFLLTPLGRRQIESDARGTSNSMVKISQEHIADWRVPVPPLAQQRVIADYLDRETARLDALVAAKERVLALLAEKRRALITRAVTRGLDPRAPLRDSGIPWLGEIPAHWGIWKLGHLALVGNGSTPNRDSPEYWSEGAIPWLNSSVVNQEEVTAADQFVTAAALRECHLPLVRPGSVLVGITGQGKTRGQAVVLSFEATINQHIAFVTPRADLLDAWFLRWTLFAAYEFLRSISDDAGGTKGALTCEEVAALRVPLPPIAQQRAIVGHIAVVTAKLDAVRRATERTIALLKERRAALIAAAVTGQIDVGEAVA